MGNAPQAVQIVSPDAPGVTLVALTGPYPQPPPARYGPVGWLPIDALPAWQQIGRYGQPVQTQTPTNIPGVQLRCGVEDLSSKWSQPSRSPNPPWQQTQQPANVPGPQLWGQSYNGALGGIAVGGINNGLAARAVANAGGGATGQAVIIQAEHLAQSGAY